MTRCKTKQDQVEDALIAYYMPPEPGAVVIGRAQLLDLLQTLPSLSFNRQSSTLIQQLREHHPGTTLTRRDHAILTFVDDTINKLLSTTDLDYKIEGLIRSYAAFLAIPAIKFGPESITKQHQVVQLLDLLLRECLGWSEDLGILGDELFVQIEERLRAHSKGRINHKEFLKEVKTVFIKRDPIFKKMESRLANTELANLTLHKARLHSARLLNQEMDKQKFPMFIVFLLQGAWYEFLQQVIIHYGKDSREWEKASNITRALIRSLRPSKNIYKHHELMDSLPDKMLCFSQSLDFDTSSIELALMDVQEEYNAIKNGTPSEPCEFEYLSPRANHKIALQNIEKSAASEIAALKVGEWYLFDDKNEPEEKVARVKLIMNSQHAERLLFTNHNRRKGMQLDYGQMITFLENETIKPLSFAETTSELIRNHFRQILIRISDQIRKEKLETQKQQRRQLAIQHQKARQSSRVVALMKQKVISRQKKRRSMALRRKTMQKRNSAVNAVAQLHPEAWVKLPLMVGTLTPCKLVAVMPGGDRYIFANRSGIKVAEYSARQLSNLLVTENSEILDTGDEFDKVLSDIIVGLRHNRNQPFSTQGKEVALR